MSTILDESSQPEQTDNRPRPGDGEQDVDQDPRSDPSQAHREAGS